MTADLPPEATAEFYPFLARFLKSGPEHGRGDMMEHRIRTTEIEDERAYWECSCGRSGGCAEWNVDIASDKHIRDGEGRVDVHGGADDDH